MALVANANFVTDGLEHTEIGLVTYEKEPLCTHSSMLTQRVDRFHRLLDSERLNGAALLAEPVQFEA